MTIHILGQTGPKSIPGKIRSSMNALKHGGYAKTKILPFEDEDEYNKLRKDVYKALKPDDFIQKNTANQIVDSLWKIERLELRFACKREERLKELKPEMVAALIDVDDRYVPYAPDYLVTPNHKIAKKDIQDADIAVYQYDLFLKNAKGMSNYNGVWRQYPELFKGAHIWSENSVSVPLFMSHGKDLSIEWQQQPNVLLKLLEQFAAHLYYRANFMKLKPQIRLMMASWLFIQKVEMRDSDIHDELLMRERRSYQSLLDSYVKVRKSQDDHLMFLERLGRSCQDSSSVVTERNEMPKNIEQSDT